jgi:hypothetical protein
MKKYNYLIFLLFLNSCYFFQGSKAYFHEQGYLVVDCFVNDLKKKFVFDTGAGATVISEKMARELGLKPHRQILVNNRIVDVVYIPGFRINKNELFQVEAGVIDFRNDVFEDQSIEGVIGLNIINLFIWDFDLIKNELFLSKVMPEVKDNLTSIDYRKTGLSGMPFIRADGFFFSSDTILFDTGFIGLLRLNHLKDTTNLEFVEYTEKQLLLFGYEDMRVAHYIAKDFELFGKNFESEKVSQFIFPKFKFNLIGNFIFRSSDRFIFDPINSQIFFSNGNKEYE